MLYAQYLLQIGLNFSAHNDENDDLSLLCNIKLILCCGNDCRYNSNSGIPTVEKKCN